ncbi:uncharacterized protein LOC111711948 [Eurytemora carolleeae]|uniref:uncharacterized protein LOC111711948 n=1 Tax=Eurytemora carolleeae TaxID=1294199 RepID=UPI000C75DB0B|nr:uncharacterized protein LOC111711948 [Eurytemora carolleeae]|eukprot:XP_023342203.1 uncharacterized protein LOC111711948 [Eurytemora affinis]
MKITSFIIFLLLPCINSRNRKQGFRTNSVYDEFPPNRVELKGGSSVMAYLLHETGLGRELNLGEYTVFSPTDAAFFTFFEKLGGMSQGIEKLKQNPEELERIIKNHIVRGKVIKGL